MAAFLKHEPCPNCGSKDNVAVWGNGQKWCFGCRTFTPSEQNLDSVVEKLEPKKNNDISNYITLPSDFSLSIPEEPMKWLQQYDLTYSELFKNRIGWSESKKQLVYPFYIDGRLVFWQGRYFPQQKPKNHTEGKPENHIIWLGNESKDSVVLVEDPVSMIKVSRVLPTCCLFGSSLSKHKIIGLSNMFDNLILWLDKDKTREMLTYQSMYKYMFASARIVFSDQDPKCYSTEEIKEKLL